MEKKNEITMEQFQEILDLLDSCMDDYLYVYDMKKDCCYISERAVDRFYLSSTQFYEFGKNLKKLIYPEDFKLLQEELEQIWRKEKDFHNLQYRWLDKKKRPVWINCRGRVLKDENGELTYLIGCVNEIGKKQKADNVSGLLGEYSLQRKLERREGKKSNGFFIRLGIDNLKEINENTGIHYGDLVLKRAADCIEAAVYPGEEVYRVVADEFVIVDFSDRSIEEAKQLYKKIRWNIAQNVEENGYEVFFTISAGILDLKHLEDMDYNNLMRWSEFALNQAKNGGKNKYYIYSKEDYLDFLRQRYLVQLIRQAVKNDFEGFGAYFQPIVDAKSHKLIGAETLLRFETQETGVVSPAEFVPLLEESNLIIPVGNWILNQAIEACSKIQKIVPDFWVSVNLSYIQVLKSNMLGTILASVERFQVRPASIVVELTESGLLESDQNFISFCNGLKENGIPLALDDFGTGYSNFHYLYNLNPNTIKIDRGFTLKALNNENEFNLLRHMAEMTHGIHLKLCIEGIETEEEFRRISEIHPDFIQGYFFGKPCTFEEFVENYLELR